MENITQYINPELLILVPVLYLIGMGIKQMEKIDNRFIPVILGAIGVVFSIIYVLATSDINGYKDCLMAAFTAFVQGVLCAGASVYVNQVIKQSQSNKED